MLHFVALFASFVIVVCPGLRHARLLTPDVGRGEAGLAFALVVCCFGMKTLDMIAVVGMVVVCIGVNSRVLRCLHEYRDERGNRRYKDTS